MQALKESIEYQIEQLSYYSGILHHSPASCEIARALILFIKSQLLLCAPEYSRVSLQNIPLECFRMIDGVVLEKLFEQAPPHHLTGIRLDSPDRSWFLMKLMFRFDFEKEKRTRFCKKLGVNFTGKGQKRHSLSQKDLDKAYKKKGSQYQKSRDSSRVIDLNLCFSLKELKEAYEYVSDSIKYRAQLDQRMRRFREEVRKSEVTRCA